MKCIEDEIPFEVPEGWCWCRLGSISAAIQYGLSNSAKQSGTHRLLRITDIQDGKVDWDTVPFTTVYEAENYLLSSGDIVFARTGATVGKSFLIKELPYPAVYASYLIRIRLLDGVLPDYIYQFFSSQCYWEQITDKSVGVGQPNCNGTSLKELFIPIPPFSEQNRIVPSALSALEYVINIELDKASLLETVTSIKFKILDLAIQGKLVPQNQNDEPASVLLERIRAEKEELIKAGKIKRDKKESVIFKGDDNSYYEKIGENIVDISEEIPFDIPENWSFARLEDVLVYEQPTPYIVSSTDYKNDYQTPVLTAGKSFIIGYTNETFGIKTELPVIIFDDFTTDSKYVDFPFKVKSSAMKILTAKEKLINTKFAYYAMQVVECDNYNHKRYWISEFSKKLIPLPPKKEQVEIVNAIEELYKYIDLWMHHTKRKIIL